MTGSKSIRRQLYQDSQIIGEFEHRFSELNMEHDRKNDQLRAARRRARHHQAGEGVHASKRKLSVGDKNGRPSR